jgi:hypothetical protein
MSQITRVIPIPAAGGNPVVVRCKITSSRMTVQEDGASNAGQQQGLIINILTPTSSDSANAWTVGPAIQIPPNLSLEPFLIAGYPGDHPPNTVPIGNGGSSPYPCAPGGPVTHGTPMFQVTSAGLATSIDVTENS